jgi:hypothetical protein
LCQRASHNLNDTAFEDLRFNLSWATIAVKVNENGYLLPAIFEDFSTTINIAARGAGV